VGGYKNNKIEVNLNCVKTIEDLFNIVFHESIHQLQDIKSQENIFKLIKKKTLKLSKKDRLNFRITNSFEIMAYAATFVILLKFNLIPLKDFDRFFQESELQGVYNIIKNSSEYKKFKKYLYLYYKELEINNNIIKKYIDDKNDQNLKEEYEDLEYTFITYNYEII
jgi:hypothetical protein